MSCVHTKTKVKIREQFEGIVTYLKIVYDINKKPIKSSKTLVYIKGSKYKCINKYGNNTVTEIQDMNDKNSQIFLVDYKGGKYKVGTYGARLNPVIKYMWGTGTNAGYMCNIAEATTWYKTDTMHEVVYYTMEMAPNPYRYDLKELNGFPMRWFKMRGNSDTRVEGFNKQSLSDDEFKVPAGYKSVTGKEMDDIMKNHTFNGKYFLQLGDNPFEIR